jgi:hypothetical protein
MTARHDRPLANVDTLRVPEGARCHAAPSPQTALAEWRAAERDAAAAPCGSPDERSARHRATAARDAFHDAEAAARARLTVPALGPAFDHLRGADRDQPDRTDRFA